MKTFSQFLEADGPRMVGDKSGGFFRKAKTAIGHSLPEPVRSGLTAVVVSGKMAGAETPEDKERYSTFRSKLLTGKHKLPKFPFSEGWNSAKGRAREMARIKRERLKQAKDAGVDITDKAAVKAYHDSQWEKLVKKITKKED